MCDPVGKSLVGRTPGVHLNALGSRQAAGLASKLRGVTLDAVYSSPLDRARETAEPLARAAGREVQVVDQLDEIDFGQWTGRSIASLQGDPLWARFNSHRSIARAPGGELMLEVQSRGVSALETMRREHPEGRCAIVSHGDVIKGLIAHYAGVPLDLFQRIEIAPASVSLLRISDGQVLIGGINVTGDLAWQPG